MLSEIYLHAVTKRKKGQEIKKIETSTTWGRALEILRVDKKDFSINQFERDKIMKRAAYRRALIGTEGPTFVTMDKILRAMGCTWYDWAEVYEHDAFRPARQISKLRTKAPPSQKTAGGF